MEPRRLSRKLLWLGGLGIGSLGGDYLIFLEILLSPCIFAIDLSPQKSPRMVLDERFPLCEIAIEPEMREWMR
jgi:hypothetical protein